MKVLFINICLFILSVTGYSQDSLKTYIQLAVTNNPLVQSKFNLYKASLEKIPQAGSLPDPQLTAGYFIEPMQLLGGNQRADIKLMQMFPWFGTLKASKNEATQMTNARYEQFRQSGFEIIYLVKKAWYNLYRIQKEIDLTRKNLQLLNSIQQMAQVRFRDASSLSSKPAQNMSSAPVTMGKSSSSGDMAGLLRVQMEISDLNNSILMLNDLKTTQMVRFNNLLNRGPITSVYTPDSLLQGNLPAVVSVIIDSMYKNSPLLKMLDDEQASFVSKKTMVKKMGYPMLGIGLDYALIDARPGNESMMNGKDMMMPMVNLTLPIYRKKYKSMVKEAELNRIATSMECQNTKNDLYLQYNETLANFKDADRRVDLYKGQIELAQTTMNLLITGLSTDFNNFEEVLRMQQQLLDYRFKLVEAIVDQHVAISMFENLMASN